jgi:hypothetical protein
VKQNVARESHLMTDEAAYYKTIGQHFAAHGSVNRSMGEYGKGDAHVNTLEGVFSVFKRGMKGVYQHCGEQHLRRYVVEFDFRDNNRSVLGVEDSARTTRALAGIVGKRLTYRRADSASGKAQA